MHLFVFAVFHRKHYPVSILTIFPPLIYNFLHLTSNGQELLRTEAVSLLFLHFVKNVSVDRPYVAPAAAILLIFYSCTTCTIMASWRCYSVTIRRWCPYRQHTIGLWRRPSGLGVIIRLWSVTFIQYALLFM